MAPRTRLYIMLAIFYALWICSLVTTSLFPESRVSDMSNLFELPEVNFAFLTSLFISLSFIVSELVHFLYRKYLLLRWRRTKLGAILLSKNCISREQLADALSEQKLKLGQILLKESLITEDQLHRALEYQETTPVKLGQVLRTLHLVSAEDVNWALRKRKRKLGQILREKDLITDYELSLCLAQKRWGADWRKKLWDPELLSLF